MPRIRTIKPEFFDDPDIGRLSPLAALFFIGLWTQADRAGRLVEEPSRLKHRLCPYWPSDAEPLIQELVANGFVIRYRHSDGRNLLQIRCFEKHQRPHPREARSELPGPVAKKHGKPRKNTASRVDLGREGDLGSGNGSGKEDCSEADSAPPSEPAVLTFPVVGSTACREWSLTQSQIDAWTALYPGLDVLASCRRALAWASANPTKRKTAKGMPRFLVGWLSRDQNRGGGGGPSPPTAHKSFLQLEDEERNRALAELVRRGPPPPRSS